MVDRDEPTSGRGKGDQPGDEVAQRAAARRRFAQLAIRPDAEIDLAEGALLIAAEEYPGLDVAAYIGRLDALAERVRRRLPHEAATEAATGAETGAEFPVNADEAALDALHRVLFDEEGFTGGPPEDYTNPRNSLLNDVLDRQRGLPITLSVVYCEVARRAGLQAVGIGLPGHFIVQFRGRHFSTLIDPYHRGARLQREDCAAIVRRIFGTEVEITDEHLLPASRKATLARILDNLKIHHLHHGHLAQALAAVERILMLQPSLDQVRDRGLILRDMGLVLLNATRLADPYDPGEAEANQGQQGEQGEQGEPGGQGPHPAHPLEMADPRPAIQFLSAAWFDLQLYAREAAGQADAKAVSAAAAGLWTRLGRQN